MTFFQIDSSHHLHCYAIKGSCLDPLLVCRLASMSRANSDFNCKSTLLELRVTSITRIAQFLEVFMYNSSLKKCYI